MASASSQAFLGGPPLLPLSWTQCSETCAPPTPAFFPLHSPFLAEAGEGLLPGRFSPWDMQCVQMMFAACTFLCGESGWVLMHGIVSQMSGGSSDLRQACTAPLCSSNPSAAGPRLIPTPAHHVEPRRVRLSHRGWGLGSIWSGPAGGLLEAILFSPCFKGQEPNSNRWGSGLWALEESVMCYSLTLCPILQWLGHRSN